MDKADSYEFELRELADELGLTPEQRVTLAAFFRRQIDSFFTLAAELAAEGMLDPDDDEDDRDFEGLTE